MIAKLPEVLVILVPVLVEVEVEVPGCIWEVARQLHMPD
jgi:hypothetical protein